MPSYGPLTNDSGEERVPLLGGEDYKAIVKEVNAGQKKDFQTQELKDIWTIKFEVVSFADGQPAEDVNGNQVESRWIWRDINPKANGFTAAGEPSAKRQFLLAANGITDLNAELPAGDTDDLIGREVILTIRTVPGVKDGKLRNRITNIRAFSRRRGGGKPVGQSAVSAPNTADRQPGDNGSTAADDRYMRAVASLVNDTDDPNPSEVAEIAEKLAI